MLSTTKTLGSLTSIHSSSFLATDCCALQAPRGGPARSHVVDGLTECLISMSLVPDTCGDCSQASHLRLLDR